MLAWHALAGRYGHVAVRLVRDAETTFGRPLHKTALVKLIYFMDLDHVRRYGETLTGARYRRQRMGPLTPDVLALDALNGHELNIGRGPLGGITYCVGPRPRFRPKLSADEEAVVMAVERRFPDPYDVQHLMDAAYETGPMQRVLAEEAERGAQLLGMPLDLVGGVPRAPAAVGR